MTKPESILENFLQCLRVCKEDERAFYLSSLYQHLTEYPELMGEGSEAQELADWSGEIYSNAAYDTSPEAFRKLVEEVDASKEAFDPERIDSIDSHSGDTDEYFTLGGKGANLMGYKRAHESLRTKGIVDRIITAIKRRFKNV